MRLHSLELQAFGPFADETRVDFDALGCDGLFLLHGQTGAGKTTVLDAVAFALFGRVPGARDQDRRLLSDHAAIGDVPRVVLEATIGGRRMRVTRSPEHRRPKKRGAGTTTVAASGTLVWVDGSGPALSRLAEIGEVVARILGMSAEQFFQVVLLPQGEFARFLRAGTDDREKLLEKLFETHRFNDLESWLRDRARVERARLTERLTTVDRLAAQIAGVVGEEHPAEPDADWAVAHLDAARAADTAAAADLEAAAATAAADDAALVEATRIDELHRRAARARSRLAALTDEADLLDGVAATLDAARRAEPLRSLLDDHDSAATAVERAEAAVRAAERTASAMSESAELLARLSWPPTDTDGAEIEAAIAAWSAESGRLEPIAQQLARRPEFMAAVQSLDASVVANSAEITELERIVESMPRRRAQAQQAVGEADAAAGRLPHLHRQLDAATVVRTAARRLPDARRAAEEAGRSMLQARERHLTAREARIDLYARRVAGMAGELADRLHPGEPCMVCGSAEHPAPAPAVVGGVTEDEQTRAEYLEKQTHDRRTVAEDRAAAAERELAVVAAAAGETAVADADAEVHRLGREVTAAGEAAARLEGLRTALETLDAQAESTARRLGELREAQVSRREQLESARARVVELDRVVAEATGGAVTVTERRSRLATLCRSAAGLRDARATAVVAVTRRDELRVRRDDALVAAGFDDVADARAALVDPATAQGWDERIRQASMLRAAAVAVLEDPDVVAAQAVAPIDLESVRARRAESAAAATVAAQRHSRTLDRRCALEDLTAGYWAALSVLEPALDRDREVQGLADLVAGRGQNSRQMSLRSYVLAARLEEVLIAASVRLREMSSGRYEFAHTDAAASRGRRSGLGIEVRDEYTGAVRPATTLSGGETFFASLALALGLADVVSAESGGRVLDTMFIDEGFGTLDPEALDLVMGVLDDLRSGGRVVGVVSHVEDMKARIPAQLQVIRREGGSALQMVGTAV